MVAAGASNGPAGLMRSPCAPALPLSLLTVLKIIILHPLDHHKGGVYGIERILDFSNVETLGEGGDGTSGHGLGILFFARKN